MIAKADREAFLSFVRETLDGIPLRYAIIGSTALLVRRPGVLDVLPPDIDLVMHPTDLEALVTWSRARGATVMSWDREVRDAASLGDVSGRFYLRLQFGDVRVDATYELPAQVLVDELLAKSEMLERVSIAQLKDVMALMRARGAARDRLRLERLDVFTCAQP